LILQYSCRKVQSPAENKLQPIADNNSVLNFIFAPLEKNRQKSSVEIPIIASSSSRVATGLSAAKISGCGGSFNGSYYGPGYYLYPQDTIDVSSTVEGSTITVPVSSYDVPNRFTIYSNTGTLLAGSPWMGYANYSGPWGQSLNTNPNGTLTFTRTSSAIYYLKVETLVHGTSDSYYATVSCSSPSSITKTFAGVSIKYYASTGLLQFNNDTDLSSILDSLDAQYETYNANYENQYPTLTSDQLDSVDIVKNFDEFYTFRQFESLFPGYASKRLQIEGIENTWLSNNFTGTDPDDVDPTYDDAENTIANINNKVIVGTTTYDLADSSGGGSTSSFASSALSTNSAAVEPFKCGITFNPSCFTNKRKRSGRLVTPDGSRSFICKLAIHAWCIRTGVKGKIVSFKKKNNGSWKRARMKLAISIAGYIYDNGCNSIPPGSLSLRNPAPNGYKNRKQLKVARHSSLQTWKTKTGQLATSFEAQGVASGGIGF